MSYHRKGADSFGRVSGGTAALSGYVATGADVADMGTGLEVSGDPVIALVAQLNRFAGKTVAPGGGCSERRYLTAALPLASSLDDKAATTALVILYDRYYCVDSGLFSKAKAMWASNGLQNPVPFVRANLAEIVPTLAQFADSLGYPPAAVGITKRAPGFAPAFPYGTVAVVGALAVLAIVVSRRKR